MKKLIMAVVALTFSVSVALAQSTTNSTNPNQQSEDTVKQNRATDRSTVGPRNTSDGAEHRREGKKDKASQAGKATNAGSRNNPGGESNASRGGKVGQSKPDHSTGKPAAKKDDQ